MNPKEVRRKFIKQQEVRLYKKMNDGFLDNSLFNRVYKEGVENPEQFLKFLDKSHNVLVRIATIKLLVKYLDDDDLTPVFDLMEDEDLPTELNEVIIQELGNKEEYLAKFASSIDENSRYLSLLMSKAKELGKMEYLTPLLFSDNEKIAIIVKKYTGYFEG